MGDEYTEEEKKITGNFMYGGKRHDAICDYFESAGYNEKEINDISMGVWKGIESEKLVSEKKLEKLQESNRIMKEALEFYSDDGGRDKEDISAVQKCIMGMTVVIAKGGKRAREALNKAEEL